MAKKLQKIGELRIDPLRRMANRFRQDFGIERRELERHPVFLRFSSLTLAEISRPPSLQMGPGSREMRARLSTVVR